MKAILKKDEEKDILDGFSWIYSNEVDRIEGDIDSLNTIEVYDYQYNFIGIGYINYSSKILIRVLTLKKEALDSAFFEKRILSAINHRKNLGIYNACRLIFSEGDLLPGLIVDKYEDYLVVDFETLGMDLRKDLIIDLLKKLVNSQGILERSSSPSRRKEGLKDIVRFIGKEFDTNVVIKENDVLFKVDLMNGQKTGHFFDQRYNRLKLRNYSNGKSILDLCCNTGGFTLNALMGNCDKVTSLDVSSKALYSLQENIHLNSFDEKDITLIEDDVFNYLDENNDLYDIVIFDPPAFLKEKSQLASAYNGYVKANSKALLKVKPDGYYMTYSCSGNLTLDLFLQMIEEAVKKSKRKVKIIDISVQSPDHPINVVKMTNLYLKSIILRVIE